MSDNCGSTRIILLIIHVIPNHPGSGSHTNYGELCSF